jgi:hypothetical protein
MDYQDQTRSGVWSGDQGASGERPTPAPGKRTLTMQLSPASAESRREPEARTAPVGHATAGPPVDPGELDALLDAAVRPDLPTAPIMRKATAAVRDPAPGRAFADATQGSGGEVPYRADMEQSFGQDFGGVRAYLGKSEALASLGAEAATRDGAIAFATATPSRELVAHELTHVVQERRHGAGAVQHKAAVSSPSDDAEREADTVAAAVVRGEHVSVGAAPRAQVSLRGPCYTVSKSPQLAEFGLEPHQVVVVMDNASDPINGKIGLQQLMQLKEVTVKIGSAGKTKKIPTALLDLGTFYESIDDDHDNKHKQGGFSQAKFGARPKAIGIEGNDILVDVLLHTKNAYDRMSWCVELVQQGKKSGIRLPEDRSWWNNPEWNAKEMNDGSFQSYKFRPGFEHLDADPPGQAGTVRHIIARVPLDQIKAVFGERFSESSSIVIGLRCRYDTTLEPVTADEGEFADAFGIAGQYHGEGAYRNYEDGRVDLTALRGQLDLRAGEWATDSEVWQQPLPDEPAPNLLRPFADNYADTHPEMKPLAPKGAFGGRPEGPSKLELATRIENEATLELTQLDKLQGLVGALRELVGNDAEVSRIMMSGGHPLDQFKWSLHNENKGEAQVFTDIYLDDPAFHALDSGVGIRHRFTPKAHKLNVKTGAGYNVGAIHDRSQEPGDYEETGEASDIYRRHEIGFDIDPGVTPQEIGAYLHSGLGGHDPWNKGGDEANKTSVAKKGAPIAYGQLDEKMVLQGHRTKFKLSAVSPEGATINIEISCDHTVGRTAQQYRQRSSEETDLDPFEDTRRFKHIYNIEMELEHLGAGGSAGQTGLASNDTPTPKSSTPQKSLAPQKSQAPQIKPPPIGHPGRMYMRDDTHAPQFNTRSFQVFARAQERFVRWARGEATYQGKPNGIGKGELGKAPQKLESLYQELKPEMGPPQKTLRKLPPTPQGVLPSMPSMPSMPEAKKVRPLPEPKGLPYQPQPELEPHVISPAAVQKMTELKLTPIEIKDDGDCFYEAFHRTTGMGGSVKALRERVAAYVETNKLFYRNFFQGAETVEKVCQRIRTPGSFAGVDGDLAPEVVAKLFGVAITVINGNDGTLTPLATVGTPCHLIRFTGGGRADHYYGTRKTYL